MSIVARFVIVFGLVVSAFLTGGIIIWSILASNQGHMVTANQALERSKSLQALSTTVREFKAATLAQVITRRRPQDLKTQKLLATLNTMLEEKQAIAPDMVRTVKPLVQEYTKLMAIVSDELAGSNRNRGINIYVNEAGKHEQQIIQLIETVVDDAVISAEVGVRGLEASQRILQLTTLAVGGVIVALILSILIAANKMLTDFGLIVRAMDRVAGGEKDVNLPFQSRKDEIGTMARALEAFQVAAAERRRNEAEQFLADEKRKRALLDNVSDQFENSMDRAVSGLGTSAAQILSLAQDMNTRVEAATDRIGDVSMISDEARESSIRLSATAQSITRSVQDIATSVKHNAVLTSNVSQEAKLASVRAQTLAQNALIIQKFTRSISSIASQTNMLALNATIEAARAGEAGRGFAIVAGEVKSLAAQTAQATHEITGQIEQILSDTEVVVVAVQAIEAAIDALDRRAEAIVHGIADQQKASTEIARFTEGTAEQCDRVSVELTEIRAIVGETVVATREVVASATNLAGDALRLASDANAFIEGVRAA